MKHRQTNLEWMRLVSMLLIIAHHFAVHSGFSFQGGPVTGNILGLQLLSIGGKVGVNLFVMLSAWFLLDARKINGKRLLRLWLQLVFYSVSIYLLSCLGAGTVFSVRELLAAFAPVLSRQWWFASAYVCLYLLAPWLNRLLHRLSRKRYGILLAGLGIFWFVVPVLAWLPEALREVSWFVYLYSVTGYLRLHGGEKTGSSRKWFSLGGACFLVTFALAWVGLLARARSNQRFETVYFDAHHLLILGISLLLFRGFVALKTKNSRTVNALASVCFGVYLIHDSNYLRYPLWRGLLRCAAFADSVWLIPYGLACVAGVFALCGALEALRRKAFEKFTKEREKSRVFS